MVLGGSPQGQGASADGGPGQKQCVGVGCCKGSHHLTRDEGVFLGSRVSRSDSS